MRAICFSLVLAVTHFPATAQTEVTGEITSAALFKNGLAVLTREYTLPGPGEHLAAPLGNPIHGTFWFESEVPVTVRTGTRELAADQDAPAPLDLTGALVGQKVQLFFRDPGQGSVSGTLLAAPSQLHAPAYVHDNMAGRAIDTARYSPAGALAYVVEDGGGRRRYIAADTVASVLSLGTLNTGKKTATKPVLIFEVPESATGAVTVRASYLARGLSWAPSYRIDLSDPETLRIGQSTVIRNELEDLDGVEAALISGFPSVEFEHVTSPFAPGTSWNDFFNSLNRPGGRAAHVMSQNIISNNADFFMPGELFDTGAMSASEGPDLHYQPFGRLALKRGNALTRAVAEARAAYSPVVEWRVPVLRDQQGVANDGSMNQQADMWDAVRFKNPFDFPMTTGPAMVVADGRFLGSRTTHWAGPGGETLAYISKTLSIRASAREVEAGREEALLLRQNYWKSTLEGTLSLHNRRNEPVDIIIHKELEGTLLEADGEPETAVGAAGPGRLNPSVKLTWRMRLQTGEERAVKYRYEYLIP